LDLTPLFLRLRGEKGVVKHITTQHPFLYTLLSLYQDRSGSPTLYLLALCTHQKLMCSSRINRVSYLLSRKHLNAVTEGITMTSMRVVRSPQDFHHEMIQAGSLAMHMVTDGPEGAPLVLLLHGFPEFWYGWRFQIPALAEAGYRVVAPDQRGYNLTEKRGPFDALTLVSDAVNLIQALGYETAIVIGHDWGAYVAWLVAALQPDLVEKLIVSNVPHPAASRKAIRSFYLPQWIRSWYFGFFQAPRLPEWMLSRGDFRLLAASLRQGTHGAISETELDVYRESWSQPGALTAMINWYRAFRMEPVELSKMDSMIRIPARLIWGEPDFALDKRLAEWSRRWCTDLDINYVRNSSHFVQSDRPDDFNRHMLTFLKSIKGK
jgi:pimeloyl-ACP methyl ester carboxylesterase